MSRGRRALASSSRFVLRTPLLPAQALFPDTPPSRADARTEIRALLDQPEIDEALLLASPGLHASIHEWRKDPDSVKGRKIERSLVKYLVRMSARPTPFGTLSGITAGNVAPTSAFTLLPRASYRRRTRLDNDYLFALSGALSADRALRERVRVFPNSSLYELADRLRYAEARLRGTERTYHLVAVEPTDYLRATLARCERGGYVRELAEAIVTDGADGADDADVSLDEALDYVHELIDAQLLVPDLGVTITGKEPIDALYDRLEAAGIHAVSRQLGEVRGRLAAMDSQPLGSETARYGEVAEALSALPAPVEMARLFQVDLLKPAGDVRIGKRVVDEIERAIAVLHRVAPVGRDPLAAFRRAFAERYEDRAVPLVLALDEELGIGFEASSGPGSEGSPLLQGIAFPRLPGSESEGVPMGKRERTLMHLVHSTLRRGAMELVLGEEELSLLGSGAGDTDSGKRPLPDALSAMVRVAAASADAANRGDFLVYVGSAGGPSGARLLGRFCHLADEVHAMVRDHVRAEEALRPDAVFAEIVHLNEGRIGNVICRPVLRNYEIPYLGISGAEEAFRIPVGDLRLSLERGRLILRSATLGREVVPRLSTAHNFRLRTMGVYRFLCALQDQGTMSVRWSWGPLETAPFLPRVRCGRAVLARARWLLGASELAPVTEAARAEGRARTAAELEQGRHAIALAVAALRERLAWPRYMVLAQGDNELPLDLDQPLHVDVLAHELAGQHSAEIIEQFPGPDALCVSGPEGRFASELIVAFHRTADAGVSAGAGPAKGTQAERNAPVDPRAREPRPGRPAPATLRRFPPGSAWLYAKLYTGAATADRVLCRAVEPVVRESLAAGDAESWFFVRYADPHPHLRVRFRGEPARLVAHVLPRMEEHLRPLIEAGAVWRVQLDTYEREVERYGGDAGIELAEALFFHDSEAVLAIVGQLEGDEGADARWRLAVRGADMLLDDLGFAPDARQRIFARARDLFGAEFAVTTAMQRQMGERFRAELADLDLLLARDPERDAEHWLKPGFDALAMRSAALAPIAAKLRSRDRSGALAAGLEDIAWSVVHMHINRLLHDSHRAQELVLYDFLKRYYAGRQARGGASETRGGPQ